MSDPVLRLSTLCKRFGDHQAVDAIDLSVHAGERVALLGHNGAGKTTLMKMVLGVLRPTTGTLRVFGGPAGTMAARKQIAYLPENVAFHKALTGDEHIAMYARLKGIRPADVAHLLERVDLADARGRPVGTYSKGMRQRLGLAQVLIGIRAWSCSTSRPAALIPFPVKRSTTSSPTWPRLASP